MATSFDESYLLTAAQDGTLYVHVSSHFFVVTYFNCFASAQVHVAYLLLAET